MVFLEFRNSNGVSKFVYHDKLSRSLYLLKKRVLHNEGKFQYWVSLTFAENTGSYSDKEAMGYEGYTISYGKNDRCYLSKKNISHWNGTGNIIRNFINRLKTYSKRHKSDRYIDYIWKYEEGRKSSRPHFHMIVGTNLTMKDLKKFILQSWDFGFIRVNKIDEEHGLLDYLGKYFTKGSRLRHWVSGKKWGCSRTIKMPVKVISDLEFIGFVDRMEVLETTREQKEELQKELEEHYIWYIRYLGRACMREYYQGKLLNINWSLGQVLCYNRERLIKRRKFLYKKLENY